MDKHSIFKSDDMAIIPIIAQEYGALHTKLLTYNKNPRIVESSPQKTLDNSCRFYGSTFQSLRSDTARITNINSKPPILLSPVISIFLFSTHSERSEDNVWINIEFVQDIKALKNNTTKITFSDGQSLITTATVRTIWHQYKNATYYEHIIRKRVKKIKWNTEHPIDYSKPTLDVYETLCTYLVINNTPRS